MIGGGWNNSVSFAVLLGWKKNIVVEKEKKSFPTHNCYYCLLVLAKKPKSRRQRT